MTPVQSVTIRAHRREHCKPVYLCERCLAPASYGYTVLVDNHRKRKWFCIEHRPDDDSGDMGGRDVA